MLRKSLSSVQLFLGMGGRCHGERKSLILEIKELMGGVIEITGFEAERSGLKSGSAIYWLCDLEQATVILSFSFLIYNVGHI